MSPRPQLIELGAAIADGTAVDWHAADLDAATPSERRIVGHLRLVERIAHLHASLPAGSTPVHDSLLHPAHRDARSEQDQPVTWGPLTIIEKIGTGTYGDVYRARDPRLDRPVALKLLRHRDRDTASLESAVIEEGRLMARVRHPNVVTVYGAERIEGRVGLWMELVDGWTLEEELRSRGPFSAEEIVEIGVSLAAALDAVHRAGLLHRDLKAQNVMRSVDGPLLLTDFGAGRDIAAEPVPGVSRDVAGTPLYLAPEVLDGHGASASSDTYSLGVLLYHLATGSFPVRGRSVRDLRDLHSRGDRIPLRTARSDLPAALVAAIERAIDPDPSRRYQSAVDLQRALQPLVQTPALNLRRTVAGVLIALALGGAAAVVIPWRTRTNTPRAPFAFQARDALLVARFENRTGESIFDATIEQAFERALSASHVVTLVSRERVDDALHLMNRTPETVVDRAVGRGLCLHDRGIKALLTGRIEKSGSRYVLTAEVVNPVDDAIVTTLRDEAAEEQSVADVVARQASGLRRMLGETGNALWGPTEGSAAGVELRALQLYQQARDLGRRGNWPVAIELARQVVLADPRFGSGWTWLAWAMRSMGEAASTYQPVAERALSLLDGVPEWERLWITAVHQTLIGKDEQAVPLYEALLRLRPDDAFAARVLLNTSLRLNRPDTLLVAQRLLADQRPNDLELNARAATLVLERTHDWQAARQHVDRMQAVLASDAGPPQDKWGFAGHVLFLPAYGAWLAGDIKDAIERISEIARRIDEYPAMQRAMIVPGIVFHYLAAGRGADAAQFVASLSESDRRHFFSAHVADARGDRPALREHLMVDATSPPSLFVRAGLIERARELLDRSGSGNLVREAYNEFGRGDLLLAVGAVRAAIPHLRAGLQIMKNWDRGEYDRGCESLATALRRIGQGKEAIEALEACAANQVRASNPLQTYRLDSMRLQLHLAAEYRQARRLADAEQIERDLESRLAYADADFPLQMQLREQQRTSAWH